MSAPARFQEVRGLFVDDRHATDNIFRPDKLAAVPGGGVNTLAVDPRQFTSADLSLRDTLTNARIWFGFFTDPHWYSDTFPSAWKDDNGRPLPDPLQYRKLAVTAKVNEFTRTGDFVILDFEKIPVGWQTIFLVGEAGNSTVGWRGANGQFDPNRASNWMRPTAFSNAPHQGNPADLYRQANAAYLAQLYRGDMSDVPGWQELAWDVETGMDPADAFPIYDAKDYNPEDFVPGSWLFASNRLASLFT